MRKWIKRLVFATVYIVFTLCMMILLLEALLWHIDPLGAKATVYNLITLSKLARVHPTGYQVESGTHDLIGYTVTIDDVGGRVIPDSGQGDCTIAFIGDSMTYGQGVNDSETFANLVAAEFPTVTMQNVARAGYSIENVSVLLDYYPADAYIWFVFYNDNIPAYVMPHFTTYPLALEAYASILTFEYRNRTADEVRVWGEYEPVARNIIERRDVFTFGYDDDPLAVASADWGALLIPDAKTRISFADGHPTIAGHQQIASAILPEVSAFITNVCHIE